MRYDEHFHTGYLMGVFDLFHTGHLNLIERAKEHCDLLIVGVLSDEIVYEQKGAYPVEVDEEAINALGVGFVKADILNETDVIRHDPDKLSRSVMQMVYRLQPSALKGFDVKNH